MSAESLLARRTVPPFTQLSQLFRCGIVMPLTPTDEKTLCFPNYEEEERSDSQVMWLALEEPVLTEFWSKGLVRMLNAHTGALVDEYEEEWVEAARPRGVRDGVRAFREKWQISDPEFLDVLAAIELLAEKASRRAVSLVFVL